MTARIEFCDQDTYGDDWSGWYVVFPSGDALGPFGDPEEAQAARPSPGEHQGPPQQGSLT